MSEVKAVINADWLATQIADSVYRQSKARVFNVLESQLSDGDEIQRPKLDACKRIVGDILSDIARDSARLIRDTLGDWEQEITAGGYVSYEDAEKARKAYEETISILK